MSQDKAGAITLSSDWGTFAKAVDPKIALPVLQRNVARAMDRIGRQFIRRAQLAIQAKEYAPNSPITIILKGSSTPLVANSDLWQQLTYEVSTSPGGFAKLRLGIVRQRAGEEVVNIGWYLHEGAVIDVEAHPQVRAAVMAKVSKALGEVGKLRGASKKAVQKAAEAVAATKKGPIGKWIIPPRPFITNVTDSGSFQAFARQQLGAAVKATFRKGGGGGGT